MEKSGKYHYYMTEFSWANYRAHIQQNPIYNMSEKINVSDLPPHAVAGQASPYYRGLTSFGNDIYGESVLGGISQQPHKRFVGIIPQRPLGRWMAEIIDTTQKPEEAARAYDEAPRLLRGPDTGTNSRQRDPNSSNFTNLVLSNARHTSLLASAPNVSNWNSSSSASSTPFVNQIHVIRFADEESNFSESHFTDYERPSFGWDITQTHGGRPDNSASNPNYNFQLLPHTGGSIISCTASPNDHEVLIDIIRLIERDCINYDKRVHPDNYHPVVTTFHHELKLEKKPRLLFDRGYGMMRETTLALCGQAVGAVMTNALATSSSSSSSSCAVWMSEIAVAMGLCFIMAGISLREKRRDFSVMMTKFGAIATSWAIIISLGSHLPPVMGWAVATVAFFIVAASVAFA